MTKKNNRDTAVFFALLEKPWPPEVGAFEIKAGRKRAKGIQETDKRSRHFALTLFFCSTLLRLQSLLTGTSRVAKNGGDLHWKRANVEELLEADCYLNLLMSRTFCSFLVIEEGKGSTTAVVFVSFDDELFFTRYR